MEAESRAPLACRLAIAGMMLLLWSAPSLAASQRTQNFLISAEDPQLARAVAEAAERYRRDLATYWLGKPLPPWPNPCPVRVVAGANLAAQGVTTYNPAPVRDFQMEVIGTPERILDSVLPHEVTHTILATYFGRPLPRWADEGICTTVEHAAERSKHEAKLREFLRTRRGIAMNQLFLMKEYPADVLPMYAQGYSVCRFLIDQKGPRAFIQFLGDYMRQPSWTANVKHHYGYDSLKELQDYWLAWVAQGSGPVERFAKNSTMPAGVGGGTAASVAATNVGRNLGAPEGDLNGSPRNPPTSGGANSRALLAASEMNLTSPSPAGPSPSVPNAPGPASASISPERGSTQLASTAGGGWYLRRRREVESGVEPGSQYPAVTPIVPPSVRDSGPYQSAHPQPEQQMSRSGASPSWAGPATGGQATSGQATGGHGQFMR